MTQEASYKLTIYLWLYIPIFWLILQFSGEFLLPEETILWIHSEGHAHEIIQFLLLTTSFVWCCLMLKNIGIKTHKWLSAWILMAAICCFYVAVEEISYGQSFFNWATPENWQAINNQNETNLHNTSRLLNHIPRYGLMAGIAVGGLILPTLLLLKPSMLPTRFNIIYPLPTLGVTALCLLVIALGHKLSKTLFDEKLFGRSSEVEEIFMYFFVFLYILVLRNRTKEM